jgi:hypothetical protein
MKNIKNYRKYIYGGLAVLVIGGITLGGYLYSQNTKSKESENKTQTEKKEVSSQAIDPAKTTTAPVVNAPVQTTPSTTTTTAPVALPTLANVSLTAYLSAQDSIAPDGSTPMPAGSIAPTFNMPDGTYTIQKMVGGVWKDIITNQSYPGHGGIAAWFSGPTEDNISYRILKIEGGKAASSSKTFVVRRSDITATVYTYN